MNTQASGEPATAADAISCYVNADLFKSEFRVASPFSGPATISSCHAARFGDIDVSFCEGMGPRHTRREYRHIREDRSDDILIAAPLEGRVIANQRGLTASAAPRSFIVLSSARPLQTTTLALNPRERFSVFLVRIPAPRLRRAEPCIDEFCNRFIDAEKGPGKIMLRLFEEGVMEADGLSETQRSRFGTMLIDAIVNSTIEAPELAALRSEQRESKLDWIYGKALAYITAELSNPALGADGIAEHCRVSRRYVDLAFAARSQTVGNVIRESRLLACRDELANPALNHRTIAEIAFRWGFADPAYFSRAYKIRFGASPKVARYGNASFPGPII